MFIDVKTTPLTTRPHCRRNALAYVRKFHLVSSAIIDDVVSCTSVACANAILLNHAAAKALAIHSSLLRTAMDDMQGKLFHV